MRDTIFISHATPEDNDFSIWLASRLQLLGYKVWIDKGELLGNEKFWEEIDRTIRTRAVKFLLVYSWNICVNREPGRLKDGVSKEFNLAESVRKQNQELLDFILLLNIDKTAPHDLFIGSNRFGHIAFSDNWAHGLRDLVTKLVKDSIVKPDESVDRGFADWYENQYVAQDGIIPRRELYYSNIWFISSLPTKFFIYRFLKENPASQIHREPCEFPICKTNNILASFSSRIPSEITVDDQKIKLTPMDVHEINVDDVLKGFESRTFPTHQDASNCFKSLLRRTFHLLMKQAGLGWYEFANKRLAYFYRGDPKKTKISFKYPYRKKKKVKQLVGRYFNDFWHFAVSADILLAPQPAYRLRTHLVFTRDSYNVWEDKDKIHAHRRSKGRLFFNAEWRDMLLAFLSSLPGEKGTIAIKLNENHTLTMPYLTEQVWADFGYNEPADSSRLDLMSQYEEYEDAQDDERNEPDDAGEDRGADSP
ncbi:MAG: hypothetical protein A4E61_01605 [Syntrophorhabdus sp. PtaB.Bin184]|nr:MAG: hypothetical protein A4E61_01605 [Syntrophorhabdus sp. PtaB.Bin184]